MPCRQCMHDACMLYFHFFRWFTFDYYITCMFYDERYCLRRTLMSPQIHWLRYSWSIHISEVMFFRFLSVLAASITNGWNWNITQRVDAFNPFEVPLVNTNLLCSGATITYFPSASSKIEAIFGLVLTIVLAEFLQFSGVLCKC